MTIIAGILAFFFLPDTPSTARYLTHDEQEFAAHRLRMDLHGATSSEHVEEEKFSWNAVSITKSYPPLCMQSFSTDQTPRSNSQFSTSTPSSCPLVSSSS